MWVQAGAHVDVDVVHAHRRVADQHFARTGFAEGLLFPAQPVRTAAFVQPDCLGHVRTPLANAGCLLWYPARMGVWSRKSIETLRAEAHGGERPALQRSLGILNLTAFGVGNTVGAGIFVLTGTVAALRAGPGVTL